MMNSRFSLVLTIWILLCGMSAEIYAQGARPSNLPPKSSSPHSYAPPSGLTPGQIPPQMPSPNSPSNMPSNAPANLGEDLPTMPNVGMPPTMENVGAAMQGLPPRDPFRLPEVLIIRIRQKNATTVTTGIDPTIDAIRRFPLASYQLVGIIWDVKKPKAMFMDRLNSIHVVQVNDFIGNAKGVVTSIQSGAVTVLEGRIPQIIKLKK